MNRFSYLLSLLDWRDRLMVAGLLVVLLGSTAGVAYTTGAHRGREARQADCRDRIEAQARMRGYQVVRMAFPCSEWRR